MNDAHQTVYLDLAVTTPMLDEARDVLASELARTGNASSLHASGRAARRTVEESREIIAENLGARPSEVVFCSGGTEANNLAHMGVSRGAPPSRVLYGATDHPAVMEAAEALKERGWQELDHPIPVKLTPGRV